MPKLKVLSGDEIVKIFIYFGFEIKSQRGSHVKLVRNTDWGKQVLTIPYHKEVDKGTLKSIINQASRFISENDLMNLFYHK